MGPLPHDGEVKCSGKMAPENMENLSMKKGTQSANARVEAENSR